MRRIVLLAMLGLAGIAAYVVVPAQAAKPKKCTPHAAAYDVKGTLVSGTLSRDAGKKKTYSGTLTVHVTHTNSAAKADKGQTKTYTLSHAHVSFGGGVNHTSPAAGSRAHVQGTITVLPKKCSTTGFTATVTIKKVEINRAKKAKP